MLKWFAALTLLVSLSPGAFAGDGVHARIEGPGPDGATYTARTYGLDPDDTMEPWALAEGLVDNRRQSVLIRLTPTAEHGVYTFQRSWPAEGRWMIRYNVGHPPAPATVVRLRSDGTVRSNKLHRVSDGARECSRSLGGGRRPKGRAKGLSDDC